jgi:hypothetical protein
MQEASARLPGNPASLPYWQSTVYRSGLGQSAIDSPVAGALPALQSVAWRL